MNEDPTRFEPVTQRQVSALAQALGLGAMVLDLGKVDYEIGRGVLNGRERCMWTTDGKRITIVPLANGGVIGSLSKDVDPLYTTLQRATEPDRVFDISGDLPT